eukprot:5213982-Amphidinium_carterae.4
MVGGVQLSKKQGVRSARGVCSGVGWTSAETPRHCPLKRLPRARILSDHAPEVCQGGAPKRSTSGSSLREPRTQKSQGQARNPQKEMWQVHTDKPKVWRHCRMTVTRTKRIRCQVQSNGYKQ